MFEMPLVGRDANRAVGKERIIAFVRSDFDCATHAVKPCISRWPTFAAPTMKAGLRRNIPRLPLVGPRPKRRQAKLLAVRLSHDDIERYFVERIAIASPCRKQNLDRHVGLSADSLHSAAQASFTATTMTRTAIAARVMWEKAVSRISSRFRQTVDRTILPIFGLQVDDKRI